MSTQKTFEKKFATYDRKLQEKIFAAIENLPNGDVKRLQGDDVPPVYRLRVSKYRVLFLVDETTISVLKVDSRGDVYK